MLTSDARFVYSAQLHLCALSLPVLVGQAYDDGAEENYPQFGHTTDGVFLAGHLQVFNMTTLRNGIRNGGNVHNHQAYPALSLIDDRSSVNAYCANIMRLEYAENLVDGSALSHSQPAKEI
jgi:hypothetical protein